ncbi:hypothetical protein C8Q74DRAFT_1000026 [Fomes fomentarius]|nr:hypothetical protein C8Q74DRAFT_1000026 [Fomes fomentarius]
MLLEIRHCAPHASSFCAAVHQVTVFLRKSACTKSSTALRRENETASRALYALSDHFSSAFPKEEYAALASGHGQVIAVYTEGVRVGQRSAFGYPAHGLTITLGIIMKSR